MALLIRCFVSSLLRYFVAALLRCVAYSHPSARHYCLLLGRRSEPPRCSECALLREFVISSLFVSSWIRSFGAPLLRRFVASLLRCFVALLLGSFVVASLLGYVLASLLCCSLLRCFFAFRSYIGITIRIHHSKSLFEVTGLGDAELCCTSLCSSLLRACICTGSH